MNGWINRIMRFISVDLTLDYGNEYVDIWSLIHLLSGVIVSVIMKRYGYNFMSIFLVGNILHLYYEYFDYKKFNVLVDDDERLLKKFQKRLEERGERLMFWMIPKKGIYNSLWDQIFHIIGLFMGYLMYERMRGMVGIFWVLFILFWLLKYLLEDKFDSLNLNDKNDVKRYVRS